MIYRSIKTSPKGGVISWVLFAVLMLSLFGLLLFWQNKVSRQELNTYRKTNPIESIEEKQKTFATEKLSEEEKIEEDQKALNQVILFNDDCSSIKYNDELFQNCRNLKFYNEAIEQLDDNLCQKIESNDLKITCLDQVFFAQAKALNQETACQKIANDPLRLKCQDYYRLRFTTSSEENCNQIDNENLRAECLNNHYYESALSDLNTKRCESINEFDLKESCYQHIEITQLNLSTASSESINQFASENEPDCSEENCKNESNFNLAFEEKDLSYCQKINDYNEKEKCLNQQEIAINQFYLRQALQQTDSSLCQKILNAQIKTACLNQFNYE